MKRCSITNIRKMYIKTTMRDCLTPVGMAIINKTTNKCWQECENSDNLFQLDFLKNPLGCWPWPLVGSYYWPSLTKQLPLQKTACKGWEWIEWNQLVKQYSILSPLSNTKNCNTGEFAGGPVVKTLLFQCGDGGWWWFKSLLGVLGSHKPWCTAKKKKVATLSEGYEMIHILEEKNNRRIALFQARQHTKAMNVQKGIYVSIIKAILQAKILS